MLRSTVSFVAALGIVAAAAPLAAAQAFEAAFGEEGDLSEWSLAAD
jgi:hypothetical protein